jgi:hypothetical protein
MWIFTKDAFVSIVADKDNPDSGSLLVRARKKEHLEALFPYSRVFSALGSDYAFRTWVSRDEVKAVMCREIDEVNYTNFKNSIQDSEYHDAALNVWWAMYQMQSQPQQVN